MKLDPEVYRLAAELISQGFVDGCCSAISFHAGTFAHHTDAFAALFAPHAGTSRGHYWWPRNEHTPRIIALLLMAELVEDGQCD